MAAYIDTVDLTTAAAVGSKLKPEAGRHNSIYMLLVIAPGACRRSQQLLEEALAGILFPRSKLGALVL